MRLEKAALVITTFVVANVLHTHLSRYFQFLKLPWKMVHNSAQHEAVQTHANLDLYEKGVARDSVQNRFSDWPELSAGVPAMDDVKGS